MPGVNSAAEVMPPGGERRRARGRRRGWGEFGQLRMWMRMANNVQGLQGQALGQDRPDPSVERSVPALKQLLPSAPGEAFAARQTLSDSTGKQASAQQQPAAPSPDQASSSSSSSLVDQVGPPCPTTPRSHDDLRRKWRGWLGRDTASHDRCLPIHRAPETPISTPIGSAAARLWGGLDEGKSGS